MQELEARVSTHEAICAERYANIEKILDRIDTRTEEHGKAIQNLHLKYSIWQGVWRATAIATVIIGLVKFLGNMQ